jgi:hypothetical protein
MKFSLVSVSALILSSAISYAAADSYADAIAAWCSGKYQMKLNTIVFFYL